VPLRIHSTAILFIYIIYHEFLLFFYEIKFPYQYIQCPYVLFRNFWKTFAWKYAKKLSTTKNLFNNWENQSQAVRKQFFCNAKLWHPEFGVTFGQQSQAKIDIM